MLIPILTTIAIVAVTSWLAVIAARYLFPHIPSPLALWQARRDRIARDPRDYVRFWVARIAPSRLRVERKTTAAQTKVERSKAREDQLLTSFKDNQEPSFAYKFTAITMFAIWVVAVTAAFLIDMPIINSVSGGNAFYGILGTILLLGIPVIGSVLLGHFFAKRRANELGFVPFSLAMMVILTAVAAVIAVLMTLAPIRAEVEYVDKIREVEQQKVMYLEDGDQSAVLFAEQNLENLQAQQERSAAWNTALVPIAAMAEFSTGFFVPLAIPILLLGDARTAQRKAQRLLDTAQNRVNRQRARQYRRLSRTFQRVDLTQLDLQQHLTAVGTENQLGPAPAATIEGARAVVAAELGAQAPATPQPETAAPAPTPRETRRDDATTGAQQERTTAPVATLERDLDIPDDSFDLS